MVKLVNRAKMSTATTGTGSPITLGSAESGYQSFADAGVADGEAVRYVIEDGTAWEIGTGTYTASGTTLSRSVEESSNSDAAINLSGSAVVFATAAAADLQELITFAETFALPTSDGTTGQVLQTDGSGTLTFADAGGGGGGDLELLAVEIITTSVNAVDFDLPSGYKNFRLVFNDIGTNNAYPILRFSTDGGSSFISTSTYNNYCSATDIGASTTTTTNVDNDSGIGFSVGLNADISVLVDLIISATNVSTTGSGTGSSFSDFYRITSRGQLTTTSLVNSLRATFYSGSATYTSGTIYLYGYKDAL